MLPVSPARLISRAQTLLRLSTRPYARSTQYRHIPLKRFNTSNASSHFKPAGETCKLPSGRILGYHTSGPTNGIPVVYIHGNPDSGIQVTGSLETKVANKLGIRWIGPDRPGVGLSTKYNDHQIVHYPSDIHHLAAHLSLDRYYILGTSGGTGYALACARSPTAPHLKGIGICAGVGPVECGFDSMGGMIKKAWDIWREHPAELTAYIESTYVGLARSPDPTALRARVESDLKSYLTGDDLDHVLQPDVLNTLVKGDRQIYAQGAWAHAKGIEVNQRSWGFRLDDVKFPGIKFWYGERDVNTPPAMGRYMAQRLPGAVYKEFGGKSHLTVWDEAGLEEMLGDLVK